MTHLGNLDVASVRSVENLNRWKVYKLCFYHIQLSHHKTIPETDPQNRTDCRIGEQQKKDKFIVHDTLPRRAKKKKIRTHSPHTTTGGIIIFICVEIYHTFMAAGRPRMGTNGTTQHYTADIVCCRVFHRWRRRAVIVIIVVVTGPRPDKLQPPLLSTATATAVEVWGRAARGSDSVEL